jgi:hypothetical protein
MDARTHHSSSRASDLIPTYHGRPALKPSLYGWTVAVYIFVGGLAGAAQILATVIDLLAIPAAGRLVLIGRGIALAGAVLGAILLILDLHTKQRFYNMLRIFRPTSPMSIGTYVLISFGFWSLIAFAAQLFGFAPAATVCGVLGALSGWWMITYTAALLSATATPLWAAAPRALAMRFAASALASGGAALCLVAIWTPADRAIIAALGDITAIALIAELIASLAASLIYRRAGVDAPLRHAPWAPIHLIGVELIGVLGPAILFLTNGVVAAPGAIVPFGAAVCALAGGLLMRGVILLAGNESARRPQDYLRFAGNPRAP